MNTGEVKELEKRLANQVPWRRGSWNGSFLSLDGARAGEFEPTDIAVVHAAVATCPNDWDGNAAAVVGLIDGRFVAWESCWGPTGDGFHEDAYGGDANVYFSKTLEGAIRLGLTPRGRVLLGLEANAH